jgi:hypothetical protein
MGTIRCPCGHLFSDGDIPSPYEYNLIPDMAIEDLTKAVIKTIQQGEDIEARVSYLIMSHGATTYKCPVCGHLLVFWEGTDKLAASYKPE